MEFVSSFLFREEILSDSKGHLIEGCGHDIESSQEDLIRRFVERMREVIAKQRVHIYVLTEYGFHVPQRHLSRVPQKEDGWEDWTLIVCCEWNDDNMRDPYWYRYLYVPKGSVIKEFLDSRRKNFRKIKVESVAYQFLDCDIDSCGPDDKLARFELPNFSFVWIEGKWTSKLNFGG